MGEYAAAAEFYDLLYADEKDYETEARFVASLLHAARQGTRRVLDVGCGTGEHARLLTGLGFEVDGIDLEPAFVEAARAKCPDGRFDVADMRDFDLGGRTYDAVMCMFSAIGYVRTPDGLTRAVAAMARHLEPGGVLLLEPWFEPGQLTDGWVHALTGGRGGELQVARMSRTLVEGRVSRLEFHYLVGRPDGIEHRTETHELGLFTEAETGDAFRAAGLTVERVPSSLEKRGIYLGRRPGVGPGG